jgi:hypothetical protein
MMNVDEVAAKLGMVAESMVRSVLACSLELMKSSPAPVSASTSASLVIGLTDVINAIRSQLGIHVFGASRRELRCFSDE